MFNDPASLPFTSWTELGTSFIVLNIEEFSRNVLMSHFQHDHVSFILPHAKLSSNVHPRAQPTSTDAQTWEFSHRKFLRGHPDLLNQIKRKAPELMMAVEEENRTG